MSSIQNLPNKIDTALKLNATKSYPRFIVDGVLDQTEYDLLLEEFPDSLLTDAESKGFANYNIRPEEALPQNLPQAWQNFILTLRSETVMRELVKSCLPSAIKRYPILWRWLASIRLRNFDNYHINIAFSANYSGRFLPPHNDNSYKVLALVLYFAPADFTSSQDGTKFYTPRSKRVLREALRRFNRLSNSRLTRHTPLVLQPMISAGIHNNALTSNDIKASENWFYSNFDNDLNIEFQQNRIAGFIKTQSSFHAVDMRSSVLVGPRRSVLINLNLKHGIVARIGQKLRVRFLKLSS